MFKWNCRRRVQVEEERGEDTRTRKSWDLYHKQLANSAQLHAMALYEQDHGHTSEANNYSKLKKDGNKAKPTPFKPHAVS